MKHLLKHVRLVLVLSLFAFRFSLFAEGWTVPDDKREGIAPFIFTPESAQKGADLFMKNCQSCHGNPTKGNFVRMEPSPGDPASEKFRNLTDGEMFFKISSGRGAMPQFQMILGEEDRWNLVSYLRSFHPGYEQPDPAMTKVTGAGKRAYMELVFDAVSKQLMVQVYTLKEENRTPVKGVEALFFVKRYFGNLSLGEGIRTDANGEIRYLFPTGIPGDSAGMVSVVVQLNERDGFGNAGKEIRVPMGEATEWIPLTVDRAMWNINARAPVWLVLVYSMTVLGVLSTLIYIMLQIRRIFYLGTPSGKESSGTK